MPSPNDNPLSSNVELNATGAQEATDNAAGGDAAGYTPPDMPASSNDTEQSEIKQAALEVARNKVAISAANLRKSEANAAAAEANSRTRQATAEAAEARLQKTKSQASQVTVNPIIGGSDDDNESNVNEYGEYDDGGSFPLSSRPLGSRVYESPETKAAWRDRNKTFDDTAQAEQSKPSAKEQKEATNRALLESAWRSRDQLYADAGHLPYNAGEDRRRVLQGFVNDGLATDDHYDEIALSDHKARFDNGREKEQRKIEQQQASLEEATQKGRNSYLASDPKKYSRQDEAGYENRARVATGFASDEDKEQYRRTLAANSLRPAEEPEAEGLGKLMKSAGMGYAIGYGAMSTFSGVTQAFSPWAQGTAYQPAQAAEQASASLFPAIGAIGGTVIGAAGGIGGELAGQFIGQALGQGAQQLTDQFTESRIFAPERAGEQLGFGRGGSAAVDEFTRSIQNATGATKVVTDTLVELGRVAPLGAGAAAGIGQIQTQLSFAAPQVIADAVSGLQQGPGMYPLLQQFGANGKLTPAQYQSLAQEFAAGGQGSQARAFEALYEGATGPADPRTGGRLGGAASAVGRTALAPFAGLYFDLHNEFVPTTQADKDAQARIVDPFGYGWDGRSNADIHPRVKSAAEKAADSAAQSSAQNIDDILASTNQGQFGVLTAQTNTSLGMSAVQLSLLRGGGSSTIDRALPGIKSDVALGATSYDAQIANYQKILDNKNTDPDVAATTAQRMAELQTQAAQEPIQLAQLQRQALEMQLSERSANFGSIGSADNLALTTGELGGKTYAQLQPQEDALLGNQRNDAAFLTTTARDTSNLLSPAERATMMGQARTLENQTANQQYNYARQIDSQRDEGADLGIDEAVNKLADAQRYGGASGLDTQYGAVASSYATKIAGLNAELARGGLKFDDREKAERALSDDTKAQGDAEFNQIGQVGNLRIQTAGYQAQEATNAYDTDVQQYGTGSKTDADIAANIASLTGERQAALDTAARFRAKYGASSTDAVQYDAEASGYQKDIVQANQKYAAFDPTPQQQTRDIKLGGEIDRLGSSFLEQGDVNDLRRQQLQNVTQEISEFEAHVNKIAAQPGGITADMEPIIEQKRQQLLGERAQDERASNTNFFERLPSMLIGNVSFAQRYMPTDAQVAARLEQTGHGALGAEQFGFTAAASGRSSYDLDFNDFQQGNLSLDALKGGGLGKTLGLRNTAQGDSMQGGPAVPNVAHPATQAAAPTQKLEITVRVQDWKTGREIGTSTTIRSVNANAQAGPAILNKMGGSAGNGGTQGP